MQIKSVSRADSDEFREIYERNFSCLYRIAYLNLGNRIDAEDAVHNVFLRLLRGGRQFDDREHERAYLICAVRNECISLRRRVRRWVCDSFEDLYESQEPASEEDHSIEIADAVCRLPRRLRELISLYYYDGFTTREIAKILGRNESTVRGQLGKARELLKEMLDDN